MSFLEGEQVHCTSGEPDRPRLSWVGVGREESVLLSIFERCGNSGPLGLHEDDQRENKADDLEMNIGFQLCLTFLVFAL